MFTITRAARVMVIVEMLEEYPSRAHQVCRNASTANETRKAEGQISSLESKSYLSSLTILLSPKPNHRSVLGLFLCASELCRDVGTHPRIERCLWGGGLVRRRGLDLSLIRPLNLPSLKKSQRPIRESAPCEPKLCRDVGTPSH